MAVVAVVGDGAVLAVTPCVPVSELMLATASAIVTPAPPDDSFRVTAVSLISITLEVAVVASI